jgi:hypothetical protein
MRKSKLLHKLGKAEEAVAVLLSLAEILKSERRTERLGQVYEQILKIDFRRRDIARALKALHAGPAYRVLKYGSVLATIAALAGAGLIVQKRMAQSEQVDAAARRVQHLLSAEKPEQAIEAIDKLAPTIVRARSIEDLRQRAIAMIAERERTLATTRRQTETTKLALASEQVERGEFEAALVTYSELVKGSGDGVTSDPAVAALLGSLVTRLDGLAKRLPFLVPPAPNVAQNEAARTQALAELAANFKDKDEVVASGIAKADADPLLERWLSQEQRTRLVASAKTVCESFEVARTRIKEYQAAQARVHSARRLEPLLVSAREHESRFEFAKALEDYRKLTEEQSNDEELKRFFRDQVERFASIERFMGIVAKATREGDFETAVGQLRALRRAHAEIPFDRLVELPLRVESLPAGATVKKNGVEVGKTPLLIAYSPAKENKFSVELEGFATEEGTVKGDKYGIVRSQLVKTPAWSITMPGVVERTPTIDEALGHAYVVDRSGTVSSIELATGKEGWRFPCADLSGLLTAPALSGGKLVFGSADGPVRCLDAHSGAKVWETPDLKCEATPRIVQDLAIVATTDAQVVALRMQDGTIAWRRPLPGPVQGAPALAPANVIVPTTNGHLVSFRLKDGYEAWRVKIADTGLTGPVVIGRDIIVAAEEGILAKVALENGNGIWRRSGLGELTLQPVLTQTHALLAEGKGLGAFALTTGIPGSTHAGNHLWSTEPALAGASVVIGTRPGPVSVLDAATLALRYCLAGTKEASAPPASTGRGHVIVGFGDRTLASYRLLP